MNTDKKNNIMRTRRNKGQALLLFAAIFPLLSIAQTDTAKVKRYEFSVEQAVAFAKKNNVEVKNALLNVKIQQETNREVTAMALPQISGTGSIIYNAKLPISLIPADIFGGPPGTFEKLPFGTKWNATYGAQL